MKLNPMKFNAMTPAQWLDRLLPQAALPLLPPQGAKRSRAYRLALPKGEALLRSLRVPRGFAGDVGDLIRAQLPKWSAWPEAEWAFRQDGEDAGLYHVAICAKGRPAGILASLPGAESIEIGGIILARRGSRERQFTFFIRRMSVVAAALAALLSIGALWAGFEAGRSAQARLAEVARLLPAAAGTGDAGFLLARIDRKLSGPSVLSDMQSLTQGLPDGAWLTALEWQPGHFRATGLAGSVDGLLEAVQAQVHLGSVAFAAPVNRSEDGHYRFTLEGKP